MSVFIIAAVTTDGKIARSETDRSLDWTSKADLQFFIKKTKEAGVVVMGRKTYETIGKPLAGRLNILMTRSAPPTLPEALEGLIETSAAPEKIISRLKDAGYKKIAIIGGAEIYKLFLDAGLITDAYLTIEPIEFGTGIDFIQHPDEIDWQLVEVTDLEGGAELRHYEVTSS